MLSFERCLLKMIERHFSQSVNRTVHRLCVSRLNFPVLDPPKDTFIKSVNLLLYNNIIKGCHSGTFHLMPLGFRVMDKLTRIIDQEMQAIGAQKIAMPTLVPANLWKKTGRWETAQSELFKLKDRHDVYYCLGPTHEELITELVSRMQPLAYKSLPLMYYQISRKFRDEMAPKYALLRGREFEMKDLYTFDASEEAARQTYDAVCEAYHKIFLRLELNYVKVLGATGNIGGSLSHEFQIPAEVGQDTILVCERCGYSINNEMLEEDSTEQSHKCSESGQKHLFNKSSAIEVGHAFLLGTKYSEPFNVCFTNKDERKVLTQMGCYGLGVTRMIQASVEVLSSDTEISWPSVIAPYQVCIIPQKEGYLFEKFIELSESLYDELNMLGNMRSEVVIDDRTSKNVGRRIKEAYKIGFPYLIVVGRQSVQEPYLLEVIDTKKRETIHMSREQLVDLLKNVITI